MSFDTGKVWNYPSTPWPFSTSASPDSNSAISSSVTDASGMILSILSSTSMSLGATVGSGSASAASASGKRLVALVVTNDNCYGWRISKLTSLLPQNTENELGTSCEQLSVCIFMSHIYGWLIVNSDHYITLEHATFFSRAALDHLEWGEKPGKL